MKDSVAKAIASLENNGFKVRFFSDENEARQAILDEIDAKATIARCGSVTCTDLGLWESLSQRGNEIIDPYRPELSAEEKDRERKRLLTADVLLTSSNAITEDGKLVNIDGVGNRVALQVFGPDLVVIVAGTNKITPNLHEALKRIKTVACPQNARRLGLATPCAQNIPCPENGCESPQRMCRATVIIEKQPRLTPTSIYLIDKSLGY